MMKQVMTRAWEIAREGVKKFGGKVREYLSASLSIAWKEIKTMSKKTIELVGSEKQIKWANDIRTKLLARIEVVSELVQHDIERVYGDDAEELEEEMEEFEEFKKSLLDVANNTSAKFYIDNFGYAERLVCCALNVIRAKKTSLLYKSFERYEFIFNNNEKYGSMSIEKMKEVF